MTTSSLKPSLKPSLPHSGTSRSYGYGEANGERYGSTYGSGSGSGSGGTRRFEHRVTFGPDQFSNDIDKTGHENNSSSSSSSSHDIHGISSSGSGLDRSGTEDGRVYTLQGTLIPSGAHSTSSVLAQY